MSKENPQKGAPVSAPRMSAEIGQEILDALLQEGHLEMVEGRYQRAKPDDDSMKWIKFFVIAAVVVAAIWALTFIVVFGPFRGVNGPHELGDSFGMINALFSGWAFAGLLITLWMQRSELRLQRQDSADNREVMKQQAKQLEKQREQFEQQVIIAEKANRLAALQLDSELARYILGEEGFHWMGSRPGARIATEKGEAADLRERITFTASKERVLARAHFSEKTSLSLFKILGAESVSFQVVEQIKPLKEPGTDLILES